MSISLDDEQQLALARFRVALADVAPEIPATEADYTSNLRDELGLDTVSIWAIATQLERLAKINILDDDVCAATTVAQLCEAIKTPVPADLDPKSQIRSEADFQDSKTRDAAQLSQLEEESQLASAADLRALFGND
ncbi:acyl carrier protein [Arcanobacterium pluranimalium]|uniref:hypothetical protein n=1 Tax=Arcanobacterium pluranimalium TaxID=108028 RepID=UPI001957A8AE|nr:hypothetical protein [Arcanobacterium pluranimalium]MBM7825561.1 acyl carrier protein [Arcanobacterium pluranimalium]